VPSATGRSLGRIVSAAIAAAGVALSPALAHGTAADQVAGPAAAAAGATARFEDERAVMDRVVVQIPGLPAAPQGQAYRVWLRTEDGKRIEFLGDLRAAPSGDQPATVVWSQPGAENLLLNYTEVLISLEAPLGPGAEPAGPVVLRGTLDPGAVPQARRLMVRWPDSRYGTASLQALRRYSESARGQVAILMEAVTHGDALVWIAVMHVAHRPRKLRLHVCGERPWLPGRGHCGCQRVLRIGLDLG